MRGPIKGFIDDMWMREIIGIERAYRFLQRSRDARRLSHFF